MTNPTPVADADPAAVVEDKDHDPPPAARLARVGVAGLIDRRSHAEALTERRDRDRASWLGVDAFTRPPTPPERQLLATVAAVHDPGRLTTCVTVRGGLYRRSWPQLGHHHPDKENHVSD
ncbi:hypothetical protein [Mycolicibacterium gilvum]|uniref:hypothetical protein n=1 Tax=Mycolicibacterium gilvum TaxID=1804 RepID=UPI0040458367